MALSAAIALGYGAACWSQTSYDASGQTAVFTLTAGAKSGPASIRSGSVSRTGKGNSVTVASMRGFIVVSLPSQLRFPSDIAMYDIAGKQLYRQRGFNGASFRLDTRLLAPGIYTVIVRIDGQNFSRRFAVSR
jgi:hypothetical protein